MKYNGVNPFDIDNSMTIIEHFTQTARQLLYLTEDHLSSGEDPTVPALMRGAIAALEVALCEARGVQVLVNSAITHVRKDVDSIIETALQGRAILASKGERYKTLMTIADELYAMGRDENDVAHKLAEVNSKHCSPPLSDREVQAIAQHRISCKSGEAVTNV